MEGDGGRLREIEGDGGRWREIHERVHGATHHWSRKILQSLGKLFGVFWIRCRQEEQGWGEQESRTTREDNKVEEKTIEGLSKNLRRRWKRIIETEQPIGETESCVPSRSQCKFQQRSYAVEYDTQLSLTQSVAQRLPTSPEVIIENWRGSVQKMFLSFEQCKHKHSLPSNAEQHRDIMLPTTSAWRGTINQGNETISSRNGALTVT